MRSAARDRYERGEMPEWFDPRWLTVEEAPMNAMIRESGDPKYQYDDTWVGGGNDDGRGNGNSGGNNGKGWWREDDPYWPLRDWGDHPMRWWTFGFAALLARKCLVYKCHVTIVHEYKHTSHGFVCVQWLLSCSSAYVVYGAAPHISISTIIAACTPDGPPSIHYP